MNPNDIARFYEAILKNALDFTFVLPEAFEINVTMSGPPALSLSEEIAKTDAIVAAFEAD